MFEPTVISPQLFDELRTSAFTELTTAIELSHFCQAGPGCEECRAVRRRHAQAVGQICRAARQAQRDSL